MTYLDDRLGVAGKVAVLIGGAGGLGLACATELGRAGMRLAIGDRDEARLAAAAAALAGEGIVVHAAALDCRDADALTAFYASVDEAYDRLDVVVNVVGGTFHQAFDQSTSRGWEALTRANFTWVLGSMQLAIPRLRAAGGGSIINLGSIEGSRAAPGFSVYAGLKAGLEHVGRSIAVEVAPDRIRINTVAPDYVPTAGLAGSMAEPATHADDAGGPSPAAVTALAHQISIPMGRVGEPEDVGGCALFLASDLSKFVTGTTLRPDGGAWASGGWFNWPDEGYRNTVPDSVAHRLLGP